MKNIKKKLLSLGLALSLIAPNAVFANGLHTDEGSVLENQIMEEYSHNDGEDYTTMPDDALYNSRATTTNKIKGNFTLPNGIKITENYITNTNNFSKTNNTQQYIVIHDTANESAGADDVAHRKYFQNNDRKVSIHYVVDKDSGIHVLQDNYSAHHVGDLNNTSPRNNRTTIGIELCVNDPKGSAGWAKVRENGVELTKVLMKTYGIPASNVIMHKDCSGKNCSSRMIANNYKEWNEFKKAIGSTSTLTETAYHKLGKVNSSDGTLNVRSKPDASASLVATLKSGQEIEVTHKVSNGWLKVKLSDGKVGYVNGTYVTILKDYPVYNGPKVGSTDLNMRADADANATLIVNLPPNTKIDTVHGKKKASNGVWWLKITALGKTGWVNSAYVENVNIDSLNDLTVKNNVTNQTINLRDEPKYTGANVLDVISKGTQITNIKSKTSNGWLRIGYNGKEGYIAQEWLDNLNLTGVPTVDPAPKKPTITAATNWREDADWQGQIIEVISAGTEVTVTGKTSNGWYLVERNGKKGFVNEDYIENVGTVPSVSAPQGDVAIVNAAINIRASKSWSGEVLATAYSNEKLTVWENAGSDGWTKVNYNGIVGYVQDKYLDRVGVEVRGTVNLDVNLRETASWSATQLGLVQNGTSVIIVDSSNAEWTKVKVPALNNKVGYINSKYIDR